MRELILTGGPWSAQQQADIIAVIAKATCSRSNACSSPCCRGSICRERCCAGAIWRRRRQWSTAGFRSIPRCWHCCARTGLDIQDQLIAAIDSQYGVFDGRTFKADRFGGWLAANNHPLAAAGERPPGPGRRRLPADGARLSRGRAIAGATQGRLPNCGCRTWRSVAMVATARSCLRLGPALAAISLVDSRYIFGPAVWLRSLIKPPPGWAVAYIDWSQQEFGIAAALSGDAAMQAAYRSGDPYLAFAKQAGAVPADATRKTYEPTRELFKQCVLARAVRHGSQVVSTEDRPTAGGRARFATGPTARPTACSGAGRMPWLTRPCCTERSGTVFGWPLYAGEQPNPRSLRNFPMQGNGAEVLRIACCLATERGIEVCAPVHDAVLIAAPLERTSKPTSWPCKRPWRKPRRRYWAGSCSAPRLKTYPDRYRDPRGGADVEACCQRPGSTTREEDGVMKYKGFVIVPVIWWQALIRMQATGTTLWVALLLLDKARRTPYPLVKLSNVAAKAVGVSRSSKARAISQLRKAGLIIVQDRPRRSPIVKVMFLKD